MIDWLFVWFNCHAWSILFCSMTCSKLFLNYALTSLLDSALWITAQVRIHTRLGHFSVCMFRFPHVHDHSEHSLILSSISIDCFILLVETHFFFRDLEGCYGLYRTFPISNLTPEPDPVSTDHLFQNKESRLGFFFLILFTL